MRAETSLPNSNTLSVVGVFGCVYLLQPSGFPEGLHKESGFEAGAACGPTRFGLSGISRDGVGSDVDLDGPTGIAAPKYENLNPVPVIGARDDTELSGEPAIVFVIGTSVAEVSAIVIGVDQTRPRNLQPPLELIHIWPRSLISLLELISLQWAIRGLCGN